MNIKPLDWQPEPFPPTGGINGSGVLRQLGRPAMDWAELLVREAVQNSWDARRFDKGPVTFRILGRVLTPEQRKTLTDTVFNQVPKDMKTASIKKALILQDSGTYGLCGPLRSDRVALSNELPHHFIRFFRNVGQTHPTVGRSTGGTYGFGKASYYLASKCSTIIVHSRCLTSKKGFESRFIAARLSAPFENDGRNYTGRHWWGKAGSGGVADPILGKDADDLATSLGIPIHMGQESGTSIMILDPGFGEKPKHDMQKFAEHVARSFWPKLVDSPEGKPTLVFNVRWEADEIVIPLKRPSLDAYRDAFRRASKQDAVEQKTPLFWTVPVICKNPVRRVGTLSLVRFDDPKTAINAEPEIDPIVGPCQHVAWMRTPHFVVRYNQHRPATSLQWAGVFVADDGLDHIFAESEPPTHDAWHPQLLPHGTHERTFVSVALRRINEHIDAFLAPNAGPGNQGDSVQPLGAFADELGALIPAVSGTGGRTAPPPPEVSSPSAPRQVRNRKPQVRVTNKRLVLHNSLPTVAVEFDVESTQGPVLVHVRSDVLLEDGSTEAERPAGADGPRLVAWVIEGVTFPADAGGNSPHAMPDGARGIILVSCPEDARIRVNLEIEGVAE